MAKDAFQGNRDLTLDKLALVTNTGTVVDISTMYREINIFEDIFSNGISGNILIADSTNLIQHLPIIGQEKIILSFKTPGHEKSLKYGLNVYKISDKIRVKEKVYTYILHFASEEIIHNSFVKIEKPYSGTGTEIAEKIFQDGFNHPPETVEESKLRHNVVIPRWKPFKAINWILGRSVKKDNPAANFLCYQNADGYHIQSIDSLYEQKPEQEYIFENAGLRPRENKKDRFRNIEEFEIVSLPNTLEWMDKGVWASTMIGFDLESKSITQTDYVYDRDFPDVNHLGGEKLKNHLGDVDGRNLSQGYFSHVHLYPNTQNNHATNWLLQRKTMMRQAEALQINITVSGDSDLRVGDVVTVNVPSNEPEYPNPEGKAVDKYLTGNYLITGLRHKLRSEEYVCIMELSRDSFAQPVPDEKTMNT